MKILAIETSCDETALALLEADGDLSSPEFKILSTALYSQIDIHKEYGGVFPALAKREHAKNLVPLLEKLDVSKKSDNENIFDSKVLEKAEEILEREPELFAKLRNFVETYEKPEIDVITVTSGPGLEPALWVGINFARALSVLWNIPVLAVNHMEGHIASVLLESKVTNFPALGLLISGGHTELVLINNWGEYKRIGETQDDAIGEAYDKVARMLDLPYPGGPEISKLAKQAREENLSNESISFPRPMIGSGDLNFSLSGLKTAVLYKVQELGEVSEENKKIVAKEFEQSVVDVLIKKTKKAVEENMANTLIVGGGVIANNYIRENLQSLAKELDIEIFLPTKEHSTDNAVMIGAAGYLKTFRENPEIFPDIKANGNLSL